MQRAMDSPVVGVKPYRVLVCDDQPDVLEALRLLLKGRGWQTVAVESMRRGACGFIHKPWDNERLLAAIHKQAESERRRKSELEIAGNVQQKLFPRNSRFLKTLDDAGQWVAAREVGGDYFDSLEIADHTMGFVLADVSGKGVPAALLMASFRNQAPGALLHPVDVP